MAHRARALPEWPLGLPEWDDPVVALASRDEATTWLAVWQRRWGAGRVDLWLPDYAGQALQVETVFPRDLRPWPAQWDPDQAVLHLDPSATAESARLLRLRPE
jgi:alpha-galactosidase